MSRTPLSLEIKSRLRAPRLSLFKEFDAYLRDPDLQALLKHKPEIFREILEEADASGFVHYTRLAAVMGLPDPSTVSRWFKSEKGKSPDFFRRWAAIEALQRIVANDIERLKDSRESIGRYTLKEHPALEVAKMGEMVTGERNARANKREMEATD